MSAPTVFFVALGLMVLAVCVGPFTKDKRVERFCMALLVGACLAMLGAVAVGLWAAWSPWELTPR